MKAGVPGVTIGLLLLGFGIFMIGDRSGRLTGSAYVFGFVLLSLGVARLLWVGWRGNIASWWLAAFPAAVLTWALYELIRQGLPLPGIGFLDELTAPTLSAAVTVAILVLGALRLARSKEIRRR